MGRVSPQRAELAVLDPSQLGRLQEFLSWATPCQCLSRIAGKPSSGEQGALDVLALLAGSSGLVAAIRFCRSSEVPEDRASHHGDGQGEPFTITATNVDEVMPILERILNA